MNLEPDLVALPIRADIAAVDRPKLIHRGTTRAARINPMTLAHDLAAPLVDVSLSRAMVRPSRCGTERHRSRE